MREQRERPGEAAAAGTPGKRNNAAATGESPAATRVQPAGVGVNPRRTAGTSLPPPPSRRGANTPLPRGGERRRPSKQATGKQGASGACARRAGQAGTEGAGRAKGPAAAAVAGRGRGKSGAAQERGESTPSAPGNRAVTRRASAKKRDKSTTNADVRARHARHAARGGTHTPHHPHPRTQHPHTPPHSRPVTNGGARAARRGAARSSPRRGRGAVSRVGDRKSVV